jgi:formylglycine-generating enzyme required for sulfatase activity
MADTRQIVKWSIERKCAFRSGEKWFLPDETYEQLASLRNIASAHSDGRVVNGICVTSWTSAQDSAKNSHNIPHSGFRIDDRLKSYGGLKAVTATCQACEANAKTELGLDIGGCFGHLDIWPDSKEFDDQLWEIIHERNLEDRLRAAFPVTDPLWYGFWINSPLRRLQAEFLYELLDAACDYDEPHDEDVRHFLKALEIAVRWELPIHTSFLPLGHVDLGWYTIFPHCPRCKANAPVGRWKESFQTEPYQCQVCNYTFNPDEHHSSEQDDRDWDADSLEKQLGNEAYESFVKEFLICRGCSPDQADDVIFNKNNGPLIWRIKQMRKRRNGTFIRLKKEKTATELTKPPPAKLSVPIASGIELVFVLIPAGEFLMGASNDEEYSSETPQHLVQIARPFYMGRFPVTQGQWTAVMGKNPSKYRNSRDLPFDQASWFGAQEFCDNLCRQHGLYFRLPTEAEWEYACRAGTTTTYAFGNTLLETQANFTPSTNLTLSSSNTSKLRPAGSYSPNAWGLYDMHGNVDEWCEDAWHPNYNGAPSDGSAWLDGEDKQPFRVMRGGWASGTEFVCTSSARRQLRADAGLRESSSEESEREDDGFVQSIFDMFYMPYGFRVVCEANTQ